MARSERRRARPIETWIEGIVRGERALIGEALTLVESTHPEDRARTREILRHLPPARRAKRVGVSGSPGVGKSTLIERLGMDIIATDAKVGVLAVDPTSKKTGGSILGDKTRMPNLSNSPNAFVRPSPAGATLGGVAARTREAMVVLEAAGYHVIIVETVGVGQSEVAVSELTDTFVLLTMPGAGDMLQGIKRGIMEVADVVLVTKADGIGKDLAYQAAANVRQALRLLPRDDGWDVPALTVSALTGEGLATAWDAVVRHHVHLENRGDLARRRGEQAVLAFRRLLNERLHDTFIRQHAETITALERAVARGTLAEDAAVEAALGTA